jgi:hypothetical protein
MNDVRKYKAIIWICSIILLPVGLFQLFYFHKWKRENTLVHLTKLEGSLKTGITILFIYLSIICVLFYQYGRTFISVMGTFY